MDGGNASIMHTTLRPWARDIDWYFEKGIISNKACRNGHWIWRPVKDKELTWLFKKKWNIYKRSEGKNYFELVQGSSYRGFDLPRVKLQ